VKVIAFVLLLCGICFSAAAEHEEPSRSERPVAEAEIGDCGARIGSTAIRYPGLGLFRHNTYDLRIAFSPNGVTLTWNLGIDHRLTLERNTLTAVVDGYKFSHANSKGTSPPIPIWVRTAKGVIAKAKYRLKTPTKEQEEALVCASEKIEAFEAGIKEEQARKEAEYARGNHYYEPSRLSERSPSPMNPSGFRSASGVGHALGLE
jgi:hypothetical protein